MLLEPGVKGIGIQVKPVGQRPEREMAGLDAVVAQQHLAQNRARTGLQRGEDWRPLQDVVTFLLSVAVPWHRRSESGYKHVPE